MDSRCGEDESDQKLAVRATSSADATQALLRTEKFSSAGEACDRHGLMEQQGSWRSDARVNSWPPDLAETLIQQTASVRGPGVSHGAALSTPWLQTWTSGGLRSTGGEVPTLMSTGMLFTLRDNVASNQWLVLNGNCDDDSDDGNERAVGLLGDLQTDSFGSSRKPALLNTNDPERFASAMPRLNALWVLVACGYMVPFTSVGSLIAYFKATYGPGFYVKLYCAFYLSGWPVSELQRRFDQSFDRKLGSSRAFLARVVAGLALQALVLLLLAALPAWAKGDLGAEKAFTLGLMVLMGSASWVCHGTACQLCGLFPPTSVAFLQTGFRTPEIYSVAMVAALGLNANATRAHVAMYYGCTALLVCVGGVAWVAVVLSPSAQHYFILKDGAHAREEKCRTTAAGPQRRAASATSGDGGSDSPPRETPVSDGASGGEARRYALLPFEAALPPPTAGPSLAPAAEEPLAVDVAVRSCRVALFLNIWSSIFVGAFFAYCPTDRAPLLRSFGGPVLEDVSAVLYFTRLFSDLAGRPLSAVACPTFLSTEEALVPACLLRLLLAAAFFLYIWPTQPLPPSNLFVLAILAVFSALSGILCVRSYEIAAAKMPTKIDQARAVAIMNTTFQAACFSAVVMGVVVSETGFFNETMGLSADGG